MGHRPMYCSAVSADSWGDHLGWPKQADDGTPHGALAPAGYGDGFAALGLRPPAWYNDFDMILIRHASLASTDAGTTLPCRVVFITLLDVFFFFFSCHADASFRLCRVQTGVIQGCRQRAYS